MLSAGGYQRSRNVTQMRACATIRNRCATDRSDGCDMNLHEWRPGPHAIVTRARHDPSVRGHTQATPLAIARTEMRRARPAADRLSHIIDSSDQVRRVEVVRLGAAVRGLVGGNVTRSFDHVSPPNVATPADATWKPSWENKNGART